LDWRDTAILARGPIAKKVQAVFAGDYYWAARTNLPEANWEHDAFAPVTGQAAVCATGPADRRPRATMMFVAAISSATERVWISTPYLVPDDALIVALSMAKARGVDVRLLIPSMADEWAVYLAGFYYERELAQLDIPVFRYQDAFMHQKCVLVDDSLVLIGSTNFDNRSLYLNFELMLAVDDPQLIANTTKMLEQDFAQSTQTGETRHPLQPMLSRAGTAIARLFSPVL
jgi:cardiolipin synthase